MAKETKFYCDRCKKEYAGWPLWIKLPRWTWGFKSLYGTYNTKVDLCSSCWEEAKAFFYGYLKKSNKAPKKEDNG